MISKPQKLRAGDLVAIVTPSAPVTKDSMDLFNSGIEFLKKDLGLRVTYTKKIFDKYFYSAGSVEERTNDFNLAWQNPEVKMIIMAQGGYSANGLLDKLDYDLIKNNPKIFTGISDGTNLLNAINYKTGLVTYHGPDLLFTFGRSLSPQIKKNIYKTFFDGNVGRLEENKDWNNKENKNLKSFHWKTLRVGKSQGKLIGGHLGILVNLIASGYIDSFQDKILFLEGTSTDYEIDSYLTTLRLSGIFDKINGLVLGWFEDFSNQGTSRRPARDILLEITSDYNFPILEIGDLGHNVENYVFPLGIKVTLDADNKLIIFDENTVI